MSHIFSWFPLLLVLVWGLRFNGLYQDGSRRDFSFSEVWFLANQRTLRSVCLFVCVCMCACLCVCERERERERERLINLPACAVLCMIFKLFKTSLNNSLVFWSFGKTQTVNQKLLLLSCGFVKCAFVGLWYTVFASSAQHDLMMCCSYLLPLAYISLQL